MRVELGLDLEDQRATHPATANGVAGHHGVTPGRTRGVDPRPRGRLLAALVAPLALLIACGTAAPPPAPPRVAPVAVVPIMAATPAANPPTPAAVLTPVPAQPMAASSTTFPIRPRVPGGPSGSVTVTTAGGAERYHIVVRGLAPGSTHAIHDHLGICGDANVSAHLRVLAVPTADATGTAVVDTVVRAFDAGAGRIVIVYASAIPALITGCAEL